MGFLVNDAYKLKTLFGRETTVGALKRHTQMFGPRPMNMWRTRLFADSVKDAYQQSAMGMSLFVPLFAYSASKMPAGQVLPTFGSEIVGIGTHATMSMVVAGAMSFIPGANCLPPGARAFAATLLCSFPNSKVTERLQQGFTALNQAERTIRRLELGGNYQDTETAAAMRRAAVQDMSSVFGARRRWLGNEAVYLHG